jgi:hypothetical protein
VSFFARQNKYTISFSLKLLLFAFCCRFPYSWHVVFVHLTALSIQKKLLGIINVDFNMADQLLNRFFAFVRYWGKKWEYNGTVYLLWCLYLLRGLPSGAPATRLLCLPTVCSVLNPSPLPPPFLMHWPLVWPSHSLSPPPKVLISAFSASKL